MHSSAEALGAPWGKDLPTVKRDNSLTYLYIVWVFFPSFFLGILQARILRAKPSRRFCCFCSCVTINKVRILAWKHRALSYLLLAPTCAWQSQLGLLVHLSLSSLWALIPSFPDTQAQRVLPSDRWWHGAIGKHGPATHSLWFCIFPQPHIYLMLMPRCLDIRDVLS